MPWAWLYVACAVPSVAVSVGVALGAPWGRLVMGGRWPGRAPLRGRLLAAAQAILLAAMAAAMVLPATPALLHWAVVALTALSLAANAVSPSRIEARLWTPLLAVMLVAGLVSGLR